MCWIQVFIVLSLVIANLSTIIFLYIQADKKLDTILNAISKTQETQTLFNKNSKGKK